jgi:hypothetical protein
MTQWKKAFAFISTTCCWSRILSVTLLLVWRWWSALDSFVTYSTHYCFPIWAHILPIVKIFMFLLCIWVLITSHTFADTRCCLGTELIKLWIVLTAYMEMENIYIYMVIVKNSRMSHHITLRIKKKMLLKLACTKCCNTYVLFKMLAFIGFRISAVSEGKVIWTVGWQNIGFPCTLLGMLQVFNLLEVVHTPVN